MLRWLYLYELSDTMFVFVKAMNDSKFYVLNIITFLQKQIFVNSLVNLNAVIPGLKKLDILERQRKFQYDSKKRKIDKI